MAVRAASRTVGADLSGCALYSTAEPCAMCFGAAWWARVSSLVFGLTMVEVKALDDDSMDEVFGPAPEMNRFVRRKLDVISGILHEECRALWR
jgi:tRNA(Arg) A34 adenosine deaminase TadA